MRSAPGRTREFIQRRSSPATRWTTSARKPTGLWRRLSASISPCSLETVKTWTTSQTRLPKSTRTRRNSAPRDELIPVGAVELKASCLGRLRAGSNVGGAKPAQPSPKGGAAARESWPKYHTGTLDPGEQSEVVDVEARYAQSVQKLTRFT